MLSTLTVLGLAVAPASSDAAFTTFGSDLAAPADTSEARQADTAYWQTTFADGRSPLAPATGQITSFRIKGTALSKPVDGVPGGETMFHLQALRAQPDGSFRILRSSQAFYVPDRDADPQTITTYVPENFCIDTGDVLVFNTVGGWDGVIGDVQRPALYPHGTPLQIFSTVRGAGVSQFTGADKTNNGDVITGSALPRHEILMQLTVGTGSDATALCPGGTIGLAPPRAPAVAPPPPRIQKATLPAGQRVTVSRKGKLSVSLFCLPGASRCAGTVRLMKGLSRPVSVGSSRFDMGPKTTGHATILLNVRGRQLFKRGRGRLTVKIVAETRPGGGVRTSSLGVTLRRRGT
ncbi:MAG: hypothetical protein QOJ35_4217 [Solirubrobacteraceae bacterium]|jgi:hypothetical protein|nr:hypothetical protein [Solirubrobacteraceae bacterium]